MNRRLVSDLLLPLIVMVVLTAVIAAMGWDLKVASLFYSPQEGWLYAKLQPWHFLYKHGPAIALAAGVAAAGTGIAGLLKPKLAHLKKPAIFLVLLLALGPGLLANTILKDHWGRPRPRQVQEFGGKLVFHQVWERGTPGKGRSFPSGHASGAFFFIAPYFLLRRSSRRRAFAFLGFGCGFGLLMGVARIIQGGHFLSDILWAGGLVYMVGAALAHLLRIEKEDAQDAQLTAEAAPITRPPAHPQDFSPADLSASSAASAHDRQ